MIVCPANPTAQSTRNSLEDKLPPPRTSFENCNHTKHENNNKKSVYHRGAVVGKKNLIKYENSVVLQYFIFEEKKYFFPVKHSELL